MFLRARQYATRAESRGHGAPVSDRHRAGARNPHQQRCALPISLLRTAYRRSALNRGDRPALRAGNRNSLARLRRAAASSDWSLLICERGAVAPLSHFPPDHAGSEPKVRHHCFCALGSTPPAQNRGDMERRPVLPVGASDRHRAGARNPHQQRCAPPISLLRTAYRRSALNRGDGSGNADLRSARAGARSAAKGEYHPAVRMTLNAGLPAERSAPPNSGFFAAARLRRAVPTGGRRSLASASLCVVACGRDWHRPANCTFMPAGCAGGRDHGSFSRSGPGRQPPGGPAGDANRISVVGGPSYLFLGADGLTRAPAGAL